MDYVELYLVHHWRSGMDYNVFVSMGIRDSERNVSFFVLHCHHGMESNVFVILGMSESMISVLLGVLQMHI